MKKPFDDNFVQLVREMNDAAKTLNDLPDDQLFTQDHISTIDDVRHAALKLANMAEATIGTFQGTPKRAKP